MHVLPPMEPTYSNVTPEDPYDTLDDDEVTNFEIPFDVRVHNYNDKNTNTDEYTYANVSFDSAVDNYVDPKVFVIFHDTQAYPEYLVQFSKETSSLAFLQKIKGFKRK